MVVGKLGTNWKFLCVYTYHSKLWQTKKLDKFVQAEQNIQAEEMLNMSWHPGSGDNEHPSLNDLKRCYLKRRPPLRWNGLSRLLVYNLQELVTAFEKIMAWPQKAVHACHQCERKFCVNNDMMTWWRKLGQFSASLATEFLKFKTYLWKISW